MEIDVKEAIRQTIAKQILDNLNTDARDALVLESMEKVLETFDVQHAIRSAAAERALEIARELYKTEEWSKKIADEIRQGFQDYLNQMRKQLTAGMIKFMHGTGENYGGHSGMAFLLKGK